MVVSRTCGRYKATCPGIAGKTWISSEEAAKLLHLRKALLYASVVPVALDAMTVDSNLEANSLKDGSRKPANVAQKHPAKHNRKQKAIALN